MSLAHSAYIAIGSNLENPIEQINKAIDCLETDPCIQLVKCARFYRSKPFGYLEQPDFINTVLMVKTSYLPFELLKYLQQVETHQGRERLIHWGPRTIDLDIILYDDLSMDFPELTLPHPRAVEREFVLIPLLDLSKDIKIAGQPLLELVKPFINHDMQVLSDVKTYHY